MKLRSTKYYMNEMYYEISNYYHNDKPSHEYIAWIWLYDRLSLTVKLQTSNNCLHIWMSYTYIQVLDTTRSSMMPHKIFYPCHGSVF